MLGPRLAALRGTMSQVELAERAGVDQSTISLLENGRRSPQEPTLRKIATGLNMSFAELLVKLYPDDFSNYETARAA